MSEPLRPLTTGELLDRTFHLYRNNFMLFAGIASIAAIIVVAGSVFLMALGISLPATGPDVDPRTMFGPLGAYYGILGLFYLLGASLATGATIFAVSRVHLGQVSSIGESYKKVFPRLGSIILVALWIILRMILMAVLLFICLFVGIFILGLIFAGEGGRLAYNVGFIFGLLAVITIYVLLFRLYFQYSLAVQACTLENTGVNESVKRSTFLTRDSLWRIFLIYFLMGVIGFAFRFALKWPAESLFKPASMAAIIWQALATFIAYTISFPISTIAISLLYYDQRVRKEAFDLQLMMESLGQAQEQAAAAPASPVG